jgi:hypothetical protein
MSYLGLTPSEYSSGEHRRQGSITKAGNTFARRALIEGAGAYRYPSKVGRHLQLRLEQLPQAIQNIGWKAQVRLWRRFRHLTTRRNMPTRWWWRSPRKWRPSSGPSPTRCQRHAKLRVLSWFTLMHSEIHSDYRMRGSRGLAQSSPALSGCKKPACLDRGRRPTDTGKVVPNPRISAGSTVVLPGSFSSHAQRSKTMTKI